MENPTRLSRDGRGLKKRNFVTGFWQEGCVSAFWGEISFVLHGFHFLS
jgi:hypothetical protein